VSDTGMVAGTTAAAGVVSQGDWTLGLSASALSGLSSAYAGVYFEKYVKGKMSSTLWIRNLQLGIYGLPLSIAYMYAKDHANLRRGGVMQVCTHVYCTTAMTRNELFCDWRRDDTSSGLLLATPGITCFCELPMTAVYHIWRG